MPKVLVSGCFDLLHNGHVMFFQEAAKHGDLYVRLGTDENIWHLKQHKTLYNNEERLFMVQSLKCVHDAKMSEGKGVYDFVKDMDDLKPDVYFVNEDASQLEGRVKICSDRGIKMVVAPRKPPQHLHARSSTDIKARITEMVHKEEKDEREVEECNLLVNSKDNIGMFNESIPWRLCFAGGWMDLKWCNELWPGSVITINIKFHPKVCSDQCGLATSSRKHAIKLWNGRIPKHLEAEQAAQYLYAAETFSHFGSERCPYSAGSQDHCGLLFPGLNKLCYDGSNWPSKVLTLNDPDDPEQARVFQWLESVLYIVEIPIKARPGDYNSQKINKLLDPAVPVQDKVAMVKALAEASECAWEGITTMNSAKLGRALSDTMRAWATMLPYTVDPYLGGNTFQPPGDDSEKSAFLKEFVSRFDAPHTQGCLFSGAGGGFLMVISDSPILSDSPVTKIKINHDHYCRSFPSGTLHSEPRDSRYDFPPFY